MSPDFDYSANPLYLSTAAGNPLRKVLKEIASRPDTDCENAFKAIEENAPGGVIDSINLAVGKGYSSARIYRLCSRPFKGNDSALEIIALAIEWACRKHKTE